MYSSNTIYRARYLVFIYRANRTGVANEHALFRVVPVLSTTQVDGWKSTNIIYTGIPAISVQVMLQIVVFICCQLFVLSII